MSLQLPLKGIRVVEFEGIGPGPMAARMLAGMGAQVTVLARANAKTAIASQAARENPLREGKRVLQCDLKSTEGIALTLAQIKHADALIEGNRPGVMERLGLGPDVCVRVNPKLVYGRMTGWGQQGPLAQAAGHDLNYVALTGLLSLSARAGQAPIVPPTIVGDASGALGLAFGITSALLDVKGGGPGRVVDAAIVDIVSMLGMLAQSIRTGGNLDSAYPSPFHDSPYYDAYECADGRHITVGALEPQFYDLFLQKLGMDDIDRSRQWNREDWPGLKQRVAATFLTRTSAHWCEILEGTDVCFAPALSISEAARHPHNVARETFRVVDESDIRPAMAPRFLSPSAVSETPAHQEQISSA